MNRNFAIYKASKDLSDINWCFPIIPENVTKVIERFHPDGILLSFSKQAALNCGVQLHKSGVLEKHACNVLG
jgi:carbamoyl-phosphate synthase large subunit